MIDTPRTSKEWHFVGNTLRDGRTIPKDGEAEFNSLVMECFNE